MTSIAHLSRTMQTLLTTTADTAAQETGFIRRRRKLSGACFVQTLVLGWLAKPQATLKELSQRTAALGVALSPQGLDQRWGKAAAACLRRVLEAAVAQVLSGPAVALPLLGRFTAVVVFDGSTVALPVEFAADFPGCGGSTPAAGAAALKLQPRLDLLRGRLDLLEVTAGRQNDQTAQSQTAPLAAGSLALFDLGFFSLAALAAKQAAGVQWLCRLKLGTAIFDASGQRWSAGRLLAAKCPHTLDLSVWLGVGERLPCRLLAQRLPPEIAALRQARLVEAARRDQTTPSAAQLDLCHWAVFVTSVPPEHLTLGEALVLYRLRWQVELLCKLWKGHGELDQSRSAQPWRILCEIYAKLLALVIQQWCFLVSCWALPAKSLWQAAQTVQAHALTLLLALRSASLRPLQQALRLLQQTIAVGCRIDTRRTQPNAYQLVLALTDEREAA